MQYSVHARITLMIRCPDQDIDIQFDKCSRNNKFIYCLKHLAIVLFQLML